MSAAEIRASMEKQGYAIVRGLVKGRELAALDEETRVQIAMGSARHPREDFIEKPDKYGVPRYFRLEWPTDRAKWQRNGSLLLVLAHPAFTDIMGALAGADFVVTGSTLIFKDSAGGPTVELHRDHFAEARRFHRDHFSGSIDIYLDHTGRHNGCLRVLPGSHQLSDCRSLLRPGFSNEDLVDLEMSPGDVLVHNNFLVHGSEGTAPGSPLRRVIYLPFQSAKWVLREGTIPGIIPSREWIGSCMKLMRLSSELRRRQSYGGGANYRPPLEWRDVISSAPLKYRPYPQVSAEAMQAVSSEIKASHEQSPA